MLDFSVERIMGFKLNNDYVDSRHLSMPPQPNAPTFADVLNRDIVILRRVNQEIINIGISRNWNKPSTNKKIRSYFNNTFLPKLIELFGRNKPIKELTEENFNKLLDALEQIRERKESTRARDDYYIFLVLEAAATHGDIEFNEYRGKAFGFTREVERTVSPTLLKALTPIQDLLIFRHLTESPDTVHGEYWGLFMMQMLGLRNGEAAGLDFADVRMLSDESYAIFIFKSAKENSNEREFSGKTWNAVRDLPLVEVVIHHLHKRRAFLEEEVKGKRVFDSSGRLVTDVNKLPIACRGKKYAVPCSANDLSRVGKRVLMAAKVTDAELKNIDKYLKSDLDKGEGWDDKDPTTYVLRRSFATHMRLLGFPVSTRKYFIGHNTDDNLDKRFSYENDDKLIKIHDLLKRHPLNRLFANNPAWEQKSIDDFRDLIESKARELGTKLDGTISSDMLLRVEGDGSKIFLEIEALQSISDIEIEVAIENEENSRKKPVSVTTTLTGSNREPQQFIDTTQATIKNYIRVLNKLVSGGFKLELGK